MAINEKPNSKLPQSLSAHEAIIASVPKDAFKAMFYMFAGKPDSKIKVFDRPIVIKPDDIKDLNDKVISKLRLHQIDQIVSSTIIKFDKEESFELGTWAEFEGFDWKISSITQELAIRWDFLIKLPAYVAPQRHTLTTRVSANPRPQDILKIVMSRDLDDDEDISHRLGMCVARVDFISHRLADELIDVVEGWIDGLRHPEAALSWFAKCEKWDTAIARAVHFSIPIFMTGLSLAILSILIPHNIIEPITNTTLILVCQWLMLSMLGLFVITRFSHYLAGKCYTAINKYGDSTPFVLTRGDENRIEKIKALNKKQILIFFFTAGFALFLNIIAGLITWYLLPK